MSIRNCFCINSTQLRILFFYGGFFFRPLLRFFWLCPHKLSPVWKRRERIGQKGRICWLHKKRWHITGSRKSCETSEQRSGTKDCLDKLAQYRKEKALKKRKREEEQEKNKRKKLDWKTKMSDITPVLISAQITKPGKVSSVPQVRKFLVKEKKLARKDQKTITETNVVEKWAELYGNALGWVFTLAVLC